MKPILQALLLADRVYRDVTGKHIIAGIFNKLLFRKGGAQPKKVKVGDEEKQLIPGGHQVGSPYAYLSLTELHGEVPCVLRYVNLKEGKVYFETRFTLQCGDPLQTAELVIPLPALPQEAGVHALELLCNDEPIGSYRVIVEEQEETSHDGNAES